MATAELNLKQLSKRIKSDKSFKVLVNVLIDEGLLTKPGLKFEKIKSDKDIFLKFIAKIYSSKADEKKESLIHSVLFCKNFKKPDVDAFMLKTAEAIKKYLGNEDRREQKKGQFLQSIVKSISGDNIKPDEIKEIDFDDEDENDDEAATNAVKPKQKEKAEPEENEEATELQARLNYFEPLVSEFSKTNLEALLKFKMAKRLFKGGESQFPTVKENLDLIEVMFAEAEDFDDDEELISLDEMKQLLKKLAKADGDKSYAFSCCGQKEAFTYTMHKRKGPKLLSKKLKKEKEETKLSFGRATIDKKAKTLVLDIEAKVIPMIYKSMKLWLRNNKPLPVKKVRILLAGAEVPAPKDEIDELLAEYELLVGNAIKSVESNTTEIEATLNEAKRLGEDADNPETNAKILDLLSTLDDLLDALEYQIKWEKGYDGFSKLYKEAIEKNPANKLKLIAKWSIAVKASEGSQFSVAMKTWAQIEPELLEIAGTRPTTESSQDTNTEGTKQGTESGNLEESLKLWESAQKDVVGELKKIEKIIKNSKHPEKDKALMLFMAVRMQLNGNPDKMKEKKNVVEMEKYLKEDDVIDDICNFGADVRTPLLAVTNKLKTIAA